MREANRLKKGVGSGHSREGTARREGHAQSEARGATRQGSDVDGREGDGAATGCCAALSWSTGERAGERAARRPRASTGATHCSSSVIEYSGERECARTPRLHRAESRDALRHSTNRLGSAPQRGRNENAEREEFEDKSSSIAMKRPNSRGNERRASNVQREAPSTHEF